MSKTIFSRADAVVIAFAFNNALPVFVDKFLEETYSTKDVLIKAYHTIRSEGTDTSSKTGLKFNKTQEKMDNLQIETAPEMEAQVKTIKAEKAPKAAKVEKAPKAEKVEKVEKEVLPKKATKADYIKTLLLTGMSPKDVRVKVEADLQKSCYASEVSTCVASLIKNGQMQPTVKHNRATINPKGFIDPGDRVIEASIPQEISAISEDLAVISDRLEDSDHSTHQAVEDEVEEGVLA